MKIVVLGGHGEFTNAVYHCISQRYAIDKVILEGNVSRFRMLKRRCKKIGLIKVIGQIFFKLYSDGIMKPASASRIQQILHENCIDTSAIPQEKIHEVNSANSAECIQALKEISPDLVLVIGTRILSEELLTSVDSVFINMHMGITPLYRGVHGGYWALADGDPEHCGVTVHMVDKGIDTGEIISQALISPTSSDNFVTYPYLQLIEGLKLFADAIEAFGNNRLFTQETNLMSKLRTHPTIGQYIKNYLLRGIK
mgnify:CR=1 FL=1